MLPLKLHSPVRRSQGFRMASTTTIRANPSQAFESTRIVAKGTAVGCVFLQSCEGSVRKESIAPFKRRSLIRLLPTRSATWIVAHFPRLFQDRVTCHFRHLLAFRPGQNSQIVAMCGFSSRQRVRLQFLQQYWRPAAAEHARSVQGNSLSAETLCQVTPSLLFYSLSRRSWYSCNLVCDTPKTS